MCVSLVRRTLPAVQISACEQILTWWQQVSFGVCEGHDKIMINLWNHCEYWFTCRDKPMQSFHVQFSFGQALHSNNTLDEKAISVLSLRQNGAIFTDILEAPICFCCSTVWTVTWAYSPWSDSLHGLSSNVTQVSAQVNHITTHLASPYNATPAPMSNHPIINSAQLLFQNLKN